MGDRSIPNFKLYLTPEEVERVEIIAMCVHPSCCFMMDDEGKVWVEVEKDDMEEIEAFISENEDGRDL
jgi:translation elongation factor P/translation initiation factor 5A